MPHDKSQLERHVNTLYYARMIQTAYFTETHEPRMNIAMGAFVSRRIWGHNDGFHTFSSMAVARGTTIIGGVIFHDYQQERGTVEMSVAGDKGRWITRSVVNDAMRFIFDMLGCQMVLGQAASNNAGALALDRRIFTREVVIPRLMGRDIDGHVFSLTEEDWRLHPLNKSAKLSP